MFDNFNGYNLLENRFVRLKYKYNVNNNFAGKYKLKL